MFCAYFLLIALAPFTTLSQSLIPKKIDKALNIAQLFNKSKCLEISMRANRDVITNKCGYCRSVGLTRSRPGGAPPVLRRYILPPYTKFTIPFRGPGSTRITNETACKGNSSTQNYQSNSQVQNNQTVHSDCVKLKRLQNGKVFLVNSCKFCKGVAIERKFSRVQRSSKQFFKLQPLQTISLNPKGASSVRILAQVNCKT